MENENLEECKQQLNEVKANFDKLKHSSQRAVQQVAEVDEMAKMILKKIEFMDDECIAALVEYEKDFFKKETGKPHGGSKMGLIQKLVDSLDAEANTFSNKRIWVPRVPYSSLLRFDVKSFGTECGYFKV